MKADIFKSERVFLLLISCCDAVVIFFIFDSGSIWVRAASNEQLISDLALAGHGSGRRWGNIIHANLSGVLPPPTSLSFYLLGISFSDVFDMFASGVNQLTSKLWYRLPSAQNMNIAVSGCSSAEKKNSQHFRKSIKWSPSGSPYGTFSPWKL